MVKKASLTPAQQVEAGTSAAGIAIDATRTLFGGTRQQGLRAGTSRFLDQGWFVGWKVAMSMYCIVWAAWWDRGEGLDIRVYLATWTHLIATACECILHPSLSIYKYLQRRFFVCMIMDANRILVYSRRDFLDSCSLQKLLRWIDGPTRLAAPGEILHEITAACRRRSPLPLSFIVALHLGDCTSTRDTAQQIEMYCCITNSVSSS